MKVTYQTCCGVDVHKTFLVATIIKTTSGVEPSYEKKRFSTFNSDIRHFKQGAKANPWLCANHLEPQLHKHPVFINQCHQVSNGAQRSEIHTLNGWFL